MTGNHFVYQHYNILHTWMTKEPIPTCLSTILKETGRQKVIIETKNKSYRALRHENNPRDI